MGTRQRKRLLQRRRAAEAVARQRGRGRTAVMTSTVLSGVAGLVVSGLAVPADARVDRSPVPTAEQVGDLTPGAPSSTINSIVDWDGSALFAVGNGDAAGLWQSDGGAPTRVFESDDFVAGTVEHLTPVGEQLFFVAEATGSPGGDDLWVTDGTEAGTTRLTDDAAVGITSLVDVSGTLFFGHNVGTNASELWKSDGTPEGTGVVLAPDPETGAPGAPVQMKAVGDKAFFVPPRYDFENSHLWVSDGTADGTFALTSGASYPRPTDIVPLGDEVFFDGYDTGHGQELWKTDGTVAGTARVKDLNTTKQAGSYPQAMVALGDRLVFRTRNDGHLSRWWRSDGTAAGTKSFADFKSRTRFDRATSVTMNGKVFFGQERDGVTQLWKTNGTSKGTKKLTSFKADVRGVLDGDPDSFVVADGRMYFVAQNRASGRELWSTDGTPEGTRIVVDARPGPASSRPEDLTVVGGEVFFTANDGVHGRELWRTGPDTEVVTPSVKADAKQKQKNNVVRVKAKVRAGETASARVSTRVTVKGATIAKLRVATGGVLPGEATKFTLTAGSAAQAKVMKAIKRWRAASSSAAKAKRAVTATVKVLITDVAGNEVTRKVTVQLT